MTRTQFNVNEILVFNVWEVYPHGVALKFHLLGFKKIHL
jgi:hypothetical protein